MKKIVLISLLCCFIFIPSFGQKQKDEFIDLYGDKATLPKLDTLYIVTFSSLSCHGCYLEIASFFEKKNVFDNKNIGVFFVVGDYAKNLESAMRRKYFYNSLAEYFPNVKKSQILFNSNIKDDIVTLFGKNYNIHSIPKIFTIINNKKTIYPYDEFIKKM
ncbi:MAG: hypothetical protein LBM25_01955 [Bacteroidales bacterium]|jgi:hypothetical protein|nr:hypothetical protein [Bacteroidales bacterium]